MTVYKTISGIEAQGFLTTQVPTWTGMLRSCDSFDVLSRDSIRCPLNSGQSQNTTPLLWLDKCRSHLCTYSSV